MVSRGRVSAVVVASVLLAACNGGARPEFDGGAAEKPLWNPEPDTPEPRPGMVWIPGGVLIAGTPMDRLPRVADEEMGGEQVVMRGFYVDMFPSPNEAGAIPTTNLSQGDAQKMCEEQGKRLCTELELERSCKGPANLTYEYGDIYKASVCATGANVALVPNGFNTECASAFGVHDLHGGAWSWTASAWKRDPAKPGLFALRGGNGVVGDLLGRCANGRGLKADTRRSDVGVRCCAGEPNTFEVVLSVTRGEPLRLHPAEDAIALQLEALLPSEVRTAIANSQPERGGSGAAKDKEAKVFRIDRLWTWHPLGNEELWIGGGCSGRHRRSGSDEARPAGRRRGLCGVLIARRRYDTTVVLAWVPSENWQPMLSETDTPRELFLHGGDQNGAFRRRVSYAWGRVDVAEKERKKKRIGYSDPTYWPP